MALKIKKASDKIERDKFKVLIYGEPGIGKTTLALTAPNPLLIDCDTGISRVSPQFRKDYMEVSNWEDIDSLLNSPQEIAQYETLIIDTAGKLLDYLSLNIIKTNYKLGSKTGGLTLQGYGQLLSEFRIFNTRVMQLGKSIVYVAHHTEQKDGEVTKMRPDITGKSLGSILREMDLVGFMQSRNNERTISFTPSDTYIGKNTCNLPNVINIPDYNSSKEKTIGSIFTKYRAMLDSQADVMIQYEALQEQIDRTIAQVNNEEDATAVAEIIKGLDEIWDSKIIARIKFNERLVELGIKWDKESKSFIKEKTND